MEYLDLYDRDRNRTGKIVKRGTKIPENYYRLVVHICVFNSEDKMLIQQRQPFKKGWSNLWDITVGGSAEASENAQTAIKRELREEIGLDIDLENSRPSITIHFSDGFNDVFIVKKDVDIKKLNLQKEEVQDVKWATKEEIFQMIDDDTFIPYTKSYIDLLFFLKDHDGPHMRKDEQII